MAATWLEEIWEEREERLYPTMFGPLRGIFPIPASAFEKFGVPADPRWLTIGAFEAEPTASRKSWLYVTSGLSNPWEDEADPSEYCGYGCELAIETMQQGSWPILILHHVACIQMLTCSKRIPGDPIGLNDRIGLKAPIDGGTSVLRNLLVTSPGSFPALLEQRSGIADFLFCVGISDAEKAYGREHGSEQLLLRLREAGAYPVTDPARASLLA